MSPKGSVTAWLDQAQAGNPTAAQPLWERYFGRLIGLARVKLRGLPLAVEDAEDVALSAFDSCYRGIEQGRFPQLNDRDNLWRLLVVITGRKAANLRRDAGRVKRGGPHDERAAATRNDETALAQAIGDEPSPEFAAQVADECQHLLDSLGDEVLRAVAVAKMEGYTNEEIAQKLGCAPRTIERKLGLIRGLWEKEMQA